MPKGGGRKKRKTQPEANIITLGDDARKVTAPKDDEELELENMIFGTSFAPAAKLHSILIDDHDDDDDLAMEDVGGGTELQNLMDTDLFFVDDGQPAATGIDSFLDNEPSSTLSSEDDDEDDSDEAAPEHASETEQPKITDQPIPSTKQRKKPAWHDPSDEPLQVPVTTGRLRKLRNAPTEAVLSGREYESRLRRQYELIHPQPEWAIKARKKKRQRDTDTLGDDEDEEDDTILTSSDILAHSRRRRTIPQGTISIERLRDANQAGSSSAGSVKAIAFHPSDQVPVLCVGSADRRVRLFNIDGHVNPLLQTLHIPELPFTNVSFTPSGTQLLFTGPRPFYYSHDLQSGFTHRSPRGLWGTTFSSSDEHGESMEVTAFGSDEMLAVAGRGGYVHLVDWKSGSGQVIGSVKAGSGDAVKSLWWTKDSKLMGMTGESEVYLWDVGERRCVKKWTDEGGGFRGSGRTMSGGGSYLGIGSSSGYVNVYNSDAWSESSAVAKPKPLKAIANLTTPISQIKFNPDAQIMAIASKEKKDGMRLIHFPSLTAFSNWPTSSTALGHVTSVDFSASSNYIAIGNARGRVLLYHLKDYGSQL